MNLTNSGVRSLFAALPLGRCRAPWRFAPGLLGLCSLLWGLLWVGDASAYAWMIRHDYAACGTCHADPSGGELLTRYGRVTSDLVLRTRYGKEAKEEGNPDAGVLWGALDMPDPLLLSGAFRNMYVITPNRKGDVFSIIPIMQADLYAQLRFGNFTMGGSLGMAKVPVGSPHARAAQVSVNQGDGINLISRSHYLGYDIGSEFVLRAGRLNLPFGVRIPEHTAWVREFTRTDRESDQQHGLALSYTSEHLRAEGMVIAGNYQTKLRPDGQFSDFSTDAVRERGYSLYVEGLGSTSFAAGVTSKVTYARLDPLTFDEDMVRQAHGLTLRWAPHKTFSIMSEMDLLLRTRASAGYVGFAQADYEPIQGLHLLLTGELLDEGVAQASVDDPPHVAVPGLGQPRVGGWFSVDWFFFRQMELRTDVLVRQDEDVQLLSQFHLYL